MCYDRGAVLSYGKHHRRDKKMEINHVLVVEDDKEIREGVQIYLKSQGYEVF